MIFYTLIIVLFNSSSLHTNEQKYGISGFWKTDKERELIKIYKDEDKLKAKIVWLKYPKYRRNQKIKGQDVSLQEKKDINNPDLNKRSNSILGLIICEDIIFKNDKFLGKFYDPNSGRTYNAELRFKNDYILIKFSYGIFCKNLKWIKSSEDFENN